MTRALSIILLLAGARIFGGTVSATPTVAAARVQHEAAPAPPPERALYVRVCAECHDLERIESLRRTENEWRNTIYQMIEDGSEASDAEYQTILDFLVRNYGAVAVNRAPADDLVTVLAISQADGEAIVAYRAAHGNFADLDDLKQVPGIDVDQLEQRKASLRFF